MGWKIQQSYGGVLTDVDVSSRNVVGVPLVAVTRIAQREEGSNVPIAGVFRFTMVTDASVSVEAVDGGDIKSPELFSGTHAVVADGASQNWNLIPGLSIILAVSAVAGDIFEIGVGCYWDATNSTWARMAPMDLVASGATSEERTFSALNDTTSVQCNTQIVATNSARVINGQTPSRPFEAFRQTGLLNPVADTDFLGRAITFDDLVSGTPNTVTLLVSGIGFDVYDVTNDAIMANGVGLKCDGTTIYRFADTTDLCSCEFILSDALAATDTATIFVSDGGDFVQISDGLTDFLAGTTPVYLTSDDAPEGAVNAGDAVAFKIRLLCPLDKDATLNQRSFSLRIQSQGA